VHCAQAILVKKLSTGNVLTKDSYGYMLIINS